MARRLKHKEGKATCATGRRVIDDIARVKSWSTDGLDKIYKKELSHELLHPREKRAEFTYQQVEAQAEAVNWCVLSALGITPVNSPTYMVLYGITADLLRQNIEAIARGVRLILSAIEAVTAATTRTGEAA